MSDRDRNFINWLTKLPDQSNGRAALAELRRGLGQPPGLAPTVGRYVQPFLTSADSGRREEAYYLVASLFGAHPTSAHSGNMGNHFAQLCEDNTDPPDNIIRRFNILLSADDDTLPDYLRQSIGLLKSKDIAINWAQLLDDVLGWENPEGKVQLQWSRTFWRRNRANPQFQNNSQTTTGEITNE
jgi:CRISPR system Cascade subunit CasB